MVVGTGDDPAIGEYERLLLSMKTTARKELVLLHADRTIVPGSTREWLKVFYQAMPSLSSQDPELLIEPTLDQPTSPCGTQSEYVLRDLGCPLKPRCRDW